MPAFKYALGCIKDPEDPRDKKLTRLPPSLRVVLPPKLDYTKKMSPVSDQGQEGTCVGFASVDGMKEYQEKSEWKKLIQLSVRYLYVEARKLDTWSSDEGTTIRSAMKALNKKGVPPEDCWKYAVHQTDKPCPNADELAKPYRIKSYAYLETPDEMRESLFINGPFVAGVYVYDKAWTAAEKTGKIPMPDKKDEMVGGHAICIVGYDDKKKLFKFKNSWGNAWGAKGYGFLPYEYMKKYSADCWSAKDLLADKNVKALIGRLLAARMQR
jgi:C1A family cysteine protease